MPQVARGPRTCPLIHGDMPAENADDHATRQGQYCTCAPQVPPPWVKRHASGESISTRT